MSCQVATEVTPKGEDTGRRRFLLWSGWTGFWVAVGAMAYSFFRFMRPRVLYEPPAVFRAGRVEDYPAGTVSEKWKKEQKVWIVHGEEGVYALVSICTHLACTPNWSEEDRQFRCPCHGSVFTLEGDVVAGPAPEPLYRAPVQLTEEGELIVGTGLHGIRLSNQRNREPERSGRRYLLRA
jgi:cytochrome b6-f complex iron-sulfur subunit